MGATGGQGKLGWKFLVGGAAVLYAVGLAAMSAFHFIDARQEIDQRRRLVHLGETLAPQPGPGAPTEPLWKACTGAVPDGTPTQFVAYVTRMDRKLHPTLPEPDSEYTKWDVDQVLTQVTSLDPLRYAGRGVDRFPKYTLLDAVRRELDPTSWPQHLEWRMRDRRWRLDQRYLAVGRFLSLTAPTVTADGFTKPEGEFLGAVIDLSTEQVLCRGRGSLLMPREVKTHGSGDTKAEAAADAAERLPGMVISGFCWAIQYAPLQEVCHLAHSCEETTDWTGWPEGRPWKPDRR